MYNFRDNVFVHKLNIFCVTLFTIVVSFSHMEATSQKWTPALYGPSSQFCKIAALGDVMSVIFLISFQSSSV